MPPAAGGGLLVRGGIVCVKVDMLARFSAEQPFYPAPLIHCLPASQNIYLTFQLLLLLLDHACFRRRRRSPCLHQPPNQPLEKRHMLTYDDTRWLSGRRLFA